MAIKIIAKQRAFFNGEIIKPGTILSIKGDKIPSWAKRVNQGNQGGNETKTSQKTAVKDNAGQQMLIPQKENEAAASDKQALSTVDLSGKTDEELNVILDELITKGLDVGVYLENTENKTVIKQIQELNTEIEKKIESQGE